MKADLAQRLMTNPMPSLCQQARVLLARSAYMTENGSKNRVLHSEV